VKMMLVNEANQGTDWPPFHL